VRRGEGTFVAAEPPSWNAPARRRLEEGATRFASLGRGLALRAATRR
jgi:hypothetical protein